MPDKSSRAAVEAPARWIWRITLKPVYQRLLGRYFEAVINRLNSTLGELTHARAELAATRAEVEQARKRLDELGDQVDGLVAKHWDTVAQTRRLAAIEERLTAPASSVATADQTADQRGEETAGESTVSGEQA